jgi:hypothetical protein
LNGRGAYHDPAFVGSVSIALYPGSHAEDSMTVRFLNDRAQPFSVGAEPFGHYVTLAPKEVVIIETDAIEDITLHDDCIAIWSKSSVRFTKNGDVLFDY